jgi:hypothetical protein
MALPGKVGAMLSASMGKAGLTSPKAAEPAADDTEPAPDDGGGLDAIFADADKLVPGLGALLGELVDRLKSEDEEQDATEG